MCLPFHLYACSKTEFVLVSSYKKINWTLNLISEPCPLPCLFKVGEGQPIPKGQRKVFLYFLLAQALPPGSRKTGNDGSGGDGPLPVTGTGVWTVVLDPGCSLEPPGSF